jgi:hypothetical protein
MLYPARISDILHLEAIGYLSNLQKNVVMPGAAWSSDKKNWDIFTKILNMMLRRGRTLEIDLYVFQLIFTVSTCCQDGNMMKKDRCYIVVAY